MVNRLRLVVGALFVAMLPFASTAYAADEATNEAVIAQQKAAAMASEILANTTNDLALCKLAAMGLPVPGTVAFSQPEPTNLIQTCTPPGGVSGGASPTNTVASGTPGCSSGPFTTFHANEINEWAIAGQKAISDKLPPPVMPPDVMALIGAC